MTGNRRRALSSAVIRPSRKLAPQALSIAARTSRSLRAPAWMRPVRGMNSPPLDEDPDLHRLLRAGHLDQEPVPRAHEILAALKDLRGRVDPDQGLGQPLLGVSGRVLHLDLGLLGAGGNPDRHGLLAPDRR